MITIDFTDYERDARQFAAQIPHENSKATRLFVGVDADKGMRTNTNPNTRQNERNEV